MDQAKLNFISKDFMLLVRDLPGEAKGKWGKMNGQQMTEHVSGFFQVSSEKIKLPLVSPTEHLPKLREFLYSDKEFRENTKAPVNIVPEEPMAARNASMPDALAELQHSISAFVEFFTLHPGKKTIHPVFGELDFDEWVLLHYKHVTHHAKQFGLI
jgi:hypothetical protein